MAKQVKPYKETREKTGGRAFCDEQSPAAVKTIQSFGMMLITNKTSLRILQASSNAAVFSSLAPEDLIGRALKDFLRSEDFRMITEFLAREHSQDMQIEHVPFRFKKEEELAVDLSIHGEEACLILELEPAGADKALLMSMHNRVRYAVSKMKAAKTLEEICAVTAREIKSITGFDKVMVYKFDPDWNGSVLAEEKEEDMESYLGFRFPASDLPAQARQAYSLNPVRHIPDISARDAELVPVLSGGLFTPSGMGRCSLRGVVPVHLEYLKNMNVRASSSFSILKSGMLWGVIACHHKTPKWIPAALRWALARVPEIMASEVTGKEMARAHKAELRVQTVYSRIAGALSNSENFFEVLKENGEDLLKLVQAGGAAIFYGREHFLIGATPPVETLRCLADRIGENTREPIFFTSELARVYPECASFSGAASGVLAARLTDHFRDFIMWFRPEVIRTITWSGNPSEALNVEKNGVNYHPRKSFSAWREMVRMQSLAWDPPEIEAARKLQMAIVEHLLRVQAEKAAMLNKLEAEVKKRTAELRRSNEELEQFAYVASHDLQEPLRTISAYADFLLTEEDRSKEDTARSLGIIQGRALRAQELVKGLLEYGKVTKNGEAFERHDLTELLREAVENLNTLAEENDARITHEPLPAAEVKRLQIVRLFQNLIANALKYRRDEPPQVHIGVKKRGEAWVFSIRDNGTGIAPEYQQRIFTIFQRIPGRTKPPGTGIGLAVCKKIIEQHNGTIWLESEVNQGTTFHFSLPANRPPLA